MGSASSKAARSTARRYPSTPSSATSRKAPAAPRKQPGTRTEAPKDDGEHQGQYICTFLYHKAGLTNKALTGSTRPDGMDPDAITGDFSQRLQQMGVAQPNPTYSPSSTAVPYSNPNPVSHPLGPVAPSSTSPKANVTLSALEARRRMQHKAEVEFEAMGTNSGKGRSFVDMRTLIDAIHLLDCGVPQADIERRLRLKTGLLDKLGRPGILSHETMV